MSSFPNQPNTGLCILSNHVFSLAPLLNILDANIGVSVKAAAVDTVIITDIIQPNCWNNTPAKPVIRVIGKNTAKIVNVDAITDRETSPVACIAACLGSLPFSRCEVIFSNTTIASSTTNPIAIERADNDIILSVLLVAIK